jgi:hypothetical protein
LLIASTAQVFNRALLLCCYWLSSKPRRDLSLDVKLLKNTQIKLMPSHESGTYDPRKIVWDGIPIEQWEPSKWKQWKPKYTASDENIKIEREYLRIKYAIQQANSALSLDRVKIKLNRSLEPA